MAALGDTVPRQSQWARWRRFCWTNLDTLVSIFLAVIAVWISLAWTKTELAIAATATILALVAFGLMRDRGERSELVTEFRGLREQVHRLQQSADPDAFFAGHSDEKELLAKAEKDVLLIQETGRLIAETCRRELLTFLERRGTLRWICTLNDDQVVQMMALRNRSLTADSLFADRMAEGIRMIQVLTREAGAFASNVEVRFLRYPIDITAALVDATHKDRDRQEALVRLQGFQVAYEDKLCFKVRAQDSPKTFELYHKQAEAMWKSSTKCIFLTGKPGVGKSTLLADIVDDLRGSHLKMVGFLTRDVRNSNGERTGFETRTIDGRRSGTLARRGKDGIYDMDGGTMEDIVIRTLNGAISDPPDLLIIDEIGPIQLKHKDFQTLIQQLLNMPAISILGIVALSGHPYLAQVQNHFRAAVREVTETERSALKAQLAQQFAPRGGS